MTPPSAAATAVEFEPPWDGLVEVLHEAARKRGSSLDVVRLVARFQAAVRAFHRRRAEPEPAPVAVRRARLHALTTALVKVEHALYAIAYAEKKTPVPAEQSVLGLLRRQWKSITGIPVPVDGHDHFVVIEAREHPFEFEEWVRSIWRARRELEFELLRASSPAKRGRRGEAPMQRLLLEVAFVLVKEDLLPLNGGYPFTACAQAAVRAAGFALPTGKDLQKKLKPIARTAHRIHGPRGDKSPAAHPISPS